MIIKTALILSLLTVYITSASAQTNKSGWVQVPVEKQSCILVRVQNSIAFDMLYGYQVWFGEQLIYSGMVPHSNSDPKKHEDEAQKFFKPAVTELFRLRQAGLCED